MYNDCKVQGIWKLHSRNHRDNCFLCDLGQLVVQDRQGVSNMPLSAVRSYDFTHLTFYQTFVETVVYLSNQLV